MRDIPIPNDWNPEVDGYTTVMACVPNSDQWKAVFLGAIQSLTYGRLWERETGDIRQAQEIANQIVESVNMSCDENFERIAVATEKMAEVMDEWYDSQYLSILELKPLILALPFGADIWAIADVLGEVFEAIALLPDIGINVKIPVQDWWRMYVEAQRFSKIMEKANDLIATTHGIATGTMGPTLSSIIEQYIDDLPVLSLLDRLLQNYDESIVRAAGLDLPTLLAGNYMTNKTDDVRNAINGGIIPSVGYNVVQKLDQLTASVQAVGLTLAAIQTGVGGVDGCGCITVGPDDESEIEDPPVIGQDDPPPGFEDWEEYADAKCTHANKITDEIMELAQRAGALSGAIVGLSIGAIIALIASIFTGVTVFAILVAVFTVGTVALGVYTALGKMLLRNPQDILDWLQELEATQQEVICELYTTSSVSVARQALRDWMTEAADAVGSSQAFEDDVASLADNILQNALINRLFDLSTPIPDDYVPAYSCDICATEHEFPWEFTGVNHGSGSFRYDGLSFTLNSGDLGGGVSYLGCRMVDVPNREDFNWCVEFISRSTMVNAGQNYTRQVYYNANDVDFYALVQYDTSHTPPGVDSFPPLNQELPISQFEFANVGSSFTVTLKLKKVVAASDQPPHTSNACD